MSRSGLVAGSIAWLIAIASAAACSHSTGTYLEIRVPANATAVELFIGDTRAGSGMIGPPASDETSPKGRYFSGEGWTSMDMSATFGALTGTSLTYRLEREAGGSNMLPRLLVVAYDGQGEPVGVKILDDIPLDSHAATLTVTLDPATSIGAASNTQPTLERVQVWRRPGDGSAQRSACALVWHPNDAAGSAVEFFVPSDDTDCDGATTTECSSSSDWNYCEVDNTKLGLSEASCMVSIEDNNACRLGGPPTCVDGGCPAPDCTPSTIVACLPAEVCATARTNNCSALDSLCLNMAIVPPNVPKLSCDLTTEQVGGYCDDAFDASTFSVLGSRVCAGVRLQTFAPMPMIGTTVIADGLTYSLSAGTSGGGTGPCVYTLTISGTQIVPPQATPVFVVIDTTPSPDELLYLPLQLQHSTTGTCPVTPGSCTVDATAPIPCP